MRDVKKTKEVKDVETQETKEGKTPSDRMLQEISDLFLKYGLRSTSMEDISRHLQISKKTLYIYFDDKSDLVRAVMLFRLRDHDIAKIKSEIAPYSAVEVLMGISGHVLNTLQGQIPINNFDIKKYHPDVYRQVNTKVQEQMMEVLKLVLEKGCKEKYFRPEVNWRVQLFLLLTQFSALGEPEALSMPRYPLAEIIPTVFENLIRAIATPKGLAELERVKTKKMLFTI